MNKKDINLLSEAYGKVQEAVDVEDLAKQDPREMEGTSSSEEAMNTDQNEVSLEKEILNVVMKQSSDVNYKEFARAIASVYKEVYSNQLINDDFIAEIAKNIKQ
jgi:hypothetical protein